MMLSIGRVFDSALVCVGVAFLAFNGWTHFLASHVIPHVVELTPELDGGSSIHRVSGFRTVSYVPYVALRPRNAEELYQWQKMLSPEHGELQARIKSLEVRATLRTEDDREILRYDRASECRFSGFAAELPDGTCAVGCYGHDFEPEFGQRYEMELHLDGAAELAEFQPVLFFRGGDDGYLKVVWWMGNVALVGLLLLLGVLRLVLS